MLRRLFNARLLQPADLKPSQPDLEVIGTFNPGAVATEKGVVLLVRVAEQPIERRAGQTGLPRWDPHSKKVWIDWESNNEIAPVDIRVVRRKRDGLVRLSFISHLRVFHSKDGRTLEPTPGASFSPANEYEEFGVEDPRITRIGDIFYFTYVAVSRHGAATALASTRDFQTFERHGILFYPENKDVVLFPEKIGGRYLALHRPNGATPFTKPEMWLASSPDLKDWGAHQHFLGGSAAWDIGRIGAGTPPIRTPEGWLEIYHGNSRQQEDKSIGAYSGGVLLLDLEEPRRILGAAGQIFIPETDYEREGFVPNVVFPTGIVQQGENLLVYYGAADTSTAVVEFSLPEILSLACGKA
ncbi:MAG TPA: glycoside hydrolase family 130 protein [Methylomirabilota bacterium]|nr:glycoside hydrolase family 130 protein [Methylomirabilota bacterium]